MVSHNSPKFATPDATPNTKIKFTDVSIRNLKPSHKRTTYHAVGMSGFGLRISPSGRKVFFYKFRFRHKEYRLTLGRYPETKLRDAIKKYADALSQVEQGINPCAQHKKVQSKKLTVNALIDKYELHSTAQGKKSAADEIRALRKDVGRLYGTCLVSEIDTDDIRAILAEVMQRKRKKKGRLTEGSPQMANHLYAYMHRMFNLAVQWGHISLNPVSPLDRPAKTNKKSRVLTPAEIRTFWYALPDTNMLRPVQYALRFMLVTMQRGVDVRMMRWEDYDEQNAVWTIPNPKNNRAWRVPLNKYAIAILTEMRDITADHDYIFSHTEKEHMKTGLLDHNLARERDKFPMAHFTPHDLRRTATTTITALGCPRYWASLMLNHTDNTVTDIYDQYSYDYEKRKAAQVMECALDHILQAKDQSKVPTLESLRQIVRENILPEHLRF